MAGEEKTAQQLAEEAAASQAEKEAAKDKAVDGKELVDGQKEEIEDIDAKLDTFYSKLTAGQKTDAPVTTVVEDGPKTADDLKKWQDEDPIAANSWIAKQTAIREIELQRGRDKRKSDSDEYMKNERAVLRKHSKAINKDGSINLDDPWVKSYVKIGKENPYLLLMPNGPKLAAAMAEELVKEQGGADETRDAYERGKNDESQRQENVVDAQTTSSTTHRPVVKSGVKLTDTEAKMAARFKMTPDEWRAYGSTKVIKDIKVG